MNSEQLLQKKFKIKEYASFYFPLLDAIKEEQDSISEEDVILDDFIPKLEKIKFEKSEKIFGKKMSMNIQQMWDKVKEMSYKYKTVDSPRVELETEYKKIYNQKFGNRKEKTMNLNMYLQKRLSISEKEAYLIESIAKDYTKKTTIKESAERFFDIYFRDALRKYKNDITPNMTLEDFCKLLDENKYRSGLSYSKLYREDRNTSGFIKEFEKAKSSILKKKESLKGYLQKNKLKEVFPVNAYFDEYLKIAIDKYKDHIKPDMTLKEFCEILDKKGLEPVSDVSYTFVYEIEKNNKRFGAIEKKFEEVKSSLFKKEESLKRYLEKRLTINSQEAELIESVVKKYIKMKSGVK